MTAELGEDNASGFVAGRWVEAQYLQAGDVLLSQHCGEVTIEQIAIARKTTTVYNFHVTDCRTYAVGNTGLLVHNASAPSGCCDPPEGYAKSLGTTTVRVSWYENGSKDITIPTAAEALVTAESVKKGGSAFSTGPKSPPWWETMRNQFLPTFPDKWERGHLIGNRLGGPGGSTWWNMVPLHDEANAPGMFNCEKKIRKAAEDGHCVKLTVTPIYGNRKVIPLHVKIEAVSLNSNWKLGPVNVPNQASVSSPC